MPMALSPRRRPREELESDDDDDTSSPDAKSNPQPDVNGNSSKRTRLTTSNLSSSLYRTPHSSLLQREKLRAQGGKRDYQPGSIVRVKLTKFVTYTDVEFHPGPSLNMVIGPNGTGKSTLVCAICLGLGYSAQHLGRAKEASEYVKHGCPEATIEIELAKDGKNFKSNIIIRCTIKREGNKTTFTINGRNHPKKAVVDLTRSLSIQIDNLCQFLPQDKVVEFAAMTPVELLKSTQRAVASQQMIDMHEELKDLGRKHQHVQAQFVADSDSLANLEGRQRLQEGDVDRIREREHTVKRVHDLEFSRPFAKYREMRGTVDGAKQRWKEAKDELQRLEAEVEPAMRRVNAKQQYMEQTQLVVTDTKQLINNAERRADSIDRRFSDLHDKHNQLVTSAEAEKKSGQKHREEVLRVEHAIKTLERQMEQPPAEMDAAAYNERLREKRRAIQSCKEQINELKEKQTETTERGREKQRRIGQARRDLEQLESQTGKQSSKLQNASVEVARLWAWVQQNPSHFKKHVFGPPIVECSIKDVRYIDQIESLFQRTQMLSFTVQTKQDFKTLSDQGSRMRLSEVNIKTMSAGLDNFPRPFGPEEMRRYGFDGWAIDYLNGPELVLSMLCADMQIHRTGVTIRDTTSQQYEMLQHSDISAWVTSKSSYRITRRREYGPDATSTQVRPTRRANVWTDQPVDLTAKRELQENIAGWEEEVAGFEAENKETQGRILTYREKIQNFMAEEKEISDEKSTLQKALSDFKALPTRLAAQQGKIAKAHEAMAVVKERIRDISNQLDDVAIQRARVALEFADAVEVLRIAHSSLHESEIMLIEATSDFETLRDHNISIRDTLEAQRREVTTTGQELEALKNEGQRLVNECRETLAEHGEVFQTFVQTLSKLSPEQLEAEIDSEKARLELMHEGGNSSVIRDYEKRQRQIDNLAARLEELNNGRTELADHIARIHGQWEPELDSLVGKISSSFSHNMAQMGCAGEVGVHKDDDFDQWAILIRVKFREDEPLSPLDSHRQSGGERAVSTIFYLMSLQSLTRSPFRVVDEINQGMDPRNERLVHRRMVGIACGIAASEGTEPDNTEGVEGDEGASRGGGSQYFLITPKLLSNLTYERGMRVLCIASGEYMPEDRGRIDFRGNVDLMRGLKAQRARVAAM